MGVWTPVFKTGDTQETKNYTPITSLLTTDKVFDQLLCKQVTVKLHHIFSSRRTAYRNGHSCETTLLRLTEDWKLAIDRKELVCILSTDMNKAFDSLSHSLTLTKLEAYGFESSALDLMRSFFNNRQNRVRIGNRESKWDQMGRGCPQGSSSGPLLWYLFQNYLPCFITTAKLSVYTADHQLYTSGTNFTAVREVLAQEGQLAASQYRDNFLLSNPDNFQAMILNPRNIALEGQYPDIRVDGRVITNTDYIKLLDVHTDCIMNFSGHISELCKKVSKKEGILLRLRNLIPCSAKLTIYKSSILPYLTYCQLVWHFCKASDSRKIERLQERTLRAYRIQN